MKYSTRNSSKNIYSGKFCGLCCWKWVSTVSSLSCCSFLYTLPPQHLWFHVWIYEFCKFNSQSSKKKLIAVHTELLWGPKKGIFECLSFFLALLVFLAEVTVLLSPLAHLTPFFGWRLLSCHHTLLTLERVTPVALLVHSSVSSRCWRSQACQYFMHLKSNTLTHIWLLQVALHVSMLSLCRCAELLSLMYFQSGNANVIVSRQCDKEVLSRLWN